METLLSPNDGEKLRNQRKGVLEMRYGRAKLLKVLHG
jgi:hypothetical protein